MLEKFTSKYTGQTLFEVAAYLVNRNFTCGRDLYPIWSEIQNTLEIDQNDYIDAVSNELDFSTLNTDGFINSIDELKYSTNLIPSGLHYFDGYYKATDWNNHLHVSKFIKSILMKNKKWEHLYVDSIYRDDEALKKYKK